MFDINEFSNCTDCCHKEVCKILEEYQQLMDDMEARLEINECFSVDIKCKHFILIPAHRSIIK